MPNQASSSQNGGGPDMPDLSAYGITASGEPARTMNSMGERVAALQFQRRVEFRAGKDGKPMLKDLLEVSRNTAAWAQTRGVQVPQPCSNCAVGNGPFTSCVVLRLPNNQRFAAGSCANCYFGHGGCRCSLRECSVFCGYSRCNTNTPPKGTSSPKLPSDSLLGQFQSTRSTSEPHIRMEVSSFCQE